METQEERVVRLEELYTHYERVTNELNDVIIKQGRKIETLEESIARMEYRLGSLSQKLETPRSLEDDKPPHY